MALEFLDKPDIDVLWKIFCRCSDDNNFKLLARNRNRNRNSNSNSNSNRNRNRNRNTNMDRVRVRDRATLRDEILLKFINKNMDNLDGMLLRLAELNVTAPSPGNKKLFYTIAAIYCGNLPSVIEYLGNNSENNYRPTAPETSLILNKMANCRGHDRGKANTCFNSLPGDQSSEKPAITIFSHHNMESNLGPVSTPDPGPDLNPDPDPAPDPTPDPAPDPAPDLDPDLEFMTTIKQDLTNLSGPYIELVTKQHNESYVIVSDIKSVLFSLLVGTAYRSFRPTCPKDDREFTGINPETHKFTDLMLLVKNTSNLLGFTGILDPQHTKYLDELSATLEHNYGIVLENISEGKNNHVNNNGYLFGKLEAEVKHNSENIRRIDDLTTLNLVHLLDEPEINQANESQSPSVDDLVNRNCVLVRQKSSFPYISFPHQYSTIIIDNQDEYIPEALLPNNFWYDHFLPLLLKALCIEPLNDAVYYGLLENHDFDSDQELARLMDIWYEDNYRVLLTYCKDVTDFFDNMVLIEKIIIKQSWDLTKKYILESNTLALTNNLALDLSQYVPFIDQYVGKRYVADEKITLLSWQYQYFGPRIWKFLHIIPELISRQPTNSQAQSIVYFIDFFMIFLKTYPGPYSQDHVNNGMVKNSELFNYPVEYLFMDWNPGSLPTIFGLNINNKMKLIKNTLDLKLFLWKFHNAVNSTIHGSGSNASPGTVGYRNASPGTVGYRNASPGTTPYTPGHWPDPEQIKKKHIRNMYIGAINKLIEYRRLFIDCLLSGQDENITKKQIINELAKKIILVMTDLDTAILKSNCLTDVYGTLISDS
jgi:hypothetical protein